MKGSYHACATCIHFVAKRIDGKMAYFCGRLGYETKTTYQFKCWEPKEKVKELMNKRGHNE
ncbi:hypothetical protein [Mesobacillus foraminis]|uniref:hypothetical protein n=1 Tax=Mesobacillus foraminis TaxID=279826 RepID=UPI000EF44010|nr:hypothetical protein [Mesobacillus foraminis]